MVFNLLFFFANIITVSLFLAANQVENKKKPPHLCCIFFAIKWNLHFPFCLRCFDSPDLCGCGGANIKLVNTFHLFPLLIVPLLWPKYILFNIWGELWPREPNKFTIRFACYQASWLWWRTVMFQHMEIYSEGLVCLMVTISLCKHKIFELCSWLFYVRFYKEEI